MKQNRKKLHGCILQLPGSAAAPTFYLEDLYPAFMNGTSADDIAESLINYARNNNLTALPGNIDLDDYECVKKNLGLCVLGIERNKEYLKDMIYETFEDLALVPMIFTNDKYGPGHIKIRRDFLELWENVTEEDVLREAKENSPNLLPVTFRQLGDNLADPAFHHHHDHFKDNNPNVSWKETLEHGEKLGIGTREYELIRM
jgi:hypothetical protein